MIFNQDGRLPRCSCDSTGQLVRRGLPVKLPEPKVESPLTLEELAHKKFPEAEPPVYDVPGAAADVARDAEKFLRFRELGAREIPSANCLLIDPQSEDARKMYARSQALYGILGSGI